MKKQYDFSNGERGKFYSPHAEFNLPIYLETEIAQFVKELAEQKNTDVSNIVNLLLRKNKELFDSVKDINERN
jgi:hypothetical protein